MSNVYGMMRSSSSLKEKWIQRLSFFKKAIVILVFFCAGASPVLAQGRNGLMDPMQLVRATLLLELNLKNCLDSPGLAEDLAILGRIKPVIFDALSERAKLLHTDKDVGDLKIAIDNWYGEQMTLALETLSQHELCSRFPPGNMRAMLRDLASERFMQRIGSYADAPFTYRQPIPLAQGSPISSYGLPSFQMAVIQDLAHNLACEDFGISAIELREQKDADVTNLPPFIGAPIRYVEAWIVECDAVELEAQVTFARDSETMKGAYQILMPGAGMSTFGVMCDPSSDKCN